MEFEGTKSGLLIPKHAARNSLPRRVTLFRKGRRAFTNALFVVIQLATVWILWKTYQDTVIPNRQKELLAEQVAQLEMDRKLLATRIDVAQKRVGLYDEQLHRRKAELASLARERDRLTAEAGVAKMGERAAKASESEARSATRRATSDLQRSQWSIYALQATQIVGVPNLKKSHELNRIRMQRMFVEDRLDAFQDHLVDVDRAWPDLSSDASYVASELRRDTGSQYPRWMTDEFADYFEREAGRLKCPKPNFTALEHDVKQRFLSMPGASARHKLVDDEMERLEKVVDECYERFSQVGDSFFGQRNIREQTIPSAVIDVLNDAINDSNSVRGDQKE